MYVKVDITNPTQAPRVIHGGESGAEPIRIEPGETVRDKVLPQQLYDTLKQGAEKAGEGNEVQITVTGQHTPAQPQPPRGAHVSATETAHATSHATAEDHKRTPRPHGG